MISNEVGSKRNYTIPLITITLLFFMWGFITCMNDILIPYLKQLFQLTFFQSMLVRFCFFGAYFIGSLIYFLISISQGDPIDKVGYKKGILFGIFLAAFGCVLFYAPSFTVPTTAKSFSEMMVRPESPST